jgi:MSHA biogenesis protein MshI
MDLLNILGSKKLSTTRTGVACTADAFAVASVRRASGGRYLLESCLSAAATPVEQAEAIESWLDMEDHRQGPISSVLDPVDYELVYVESPDVLPAEFKAAVRWRLKGVIEFPLADAVIDIFDKPEPPHRTGAKMIYVVAAKREAIARQTEMLKSAERRIDVIDIPELALRNLAALMPEAADGLILLWLQEKSAQLIVIKQSTLYIARQVSLSGRYADGSDADSPDVDAIALELQRSTDYFESQYQQPPLTNLIIAPRNERSAHLAVALEKQTSMRVQSIDLSHALDLSPGLDPSDRCSLLAIGAALREEPAKL